MDTQHVMNPTIRPATVADATGIVSIYNHYIQETTVTFETSPLSVRAMEERIATMLSQGIFLVCESTDGIIGYSYAHPWKERAAFCHTWETSVYVSHTHQGAGIGRGLMTELIGLCKKSGCHSLIACITANNEASCELHRRLGFQQVSHFVEVGYKFNQWLDTVDYELILTPRLKSCS